MNFDSFLKVSTQKKTEFSKFLAVPNRQNPTPGQPKGCESFDFFSFLEQENFQRTMDKWIKKEQFFKFKQERLMN